MRWSSSADGATGLLQSQSNTSYCTAESRPNAASAIDTETEGVTDPSLVLECSSEPEFDTQTVLFHNDNTQSDKNNVSRNKRGRPAKRNQVASSVPRTKCLDSWCRPQYTIGHYCTFCGKIQSAIGLHLLTAHRNRAAVSRILQLPLRSKERRDQLERLTAQGDHKHNRQMSQTGTRTTVSSKRPSIRSQVRGRNTTYQHSTSSETTFVRKMNKTHGLNGNWNTPSRSQRWKSSCNRADLLSMYIRCAHCGCFVLRSAVWLHRRRCLWICRNVKNVRKSSDAQLSFRTAAKSESCHVQSTSTSYHSLLNNRVDDSNVDDILNLVLDGDNDNLQSVLTEDTLIRLYAALGHQECESSDNIYSLCQELRALARLVIECRRRKPCIDLYSLIHPDHFNLVVAISRKQTAMLVDVLGRAVNIKIVDTLQRDDNVAARHAWNFRELFVLWRESLAEDDAVLHTSDNVPQQGHSSPDNRHQPLSQTFQQTGNVDYDSDTESESQEVYSQSNKACLSEANVLSDTFSDNPLKHMFPVGSFSTLALDREGCFDQTNFEVPDNCSDVPEAKHELSTLVLVPVVQGDSIDIQAVSDITHDAHVLDAVSIDQQCTVTSHDVQRMGLESSSSDKSSSQAITICQSSRENSYCYFCGQPQSQIQHHLKSVHAEEKEVIQLSSAATDGDRVQSLTKLRNLGNHRHNQKVLEDGQGTLMVLYCPKPDATPDDYSVCKGCWSYMTKAQLLRHNCKLSVQGARKRDKRLISRKLVSNSVVSSGLRKAGGIHIMSCLAVQGSKKVKTLKVPCYFCGDWHFQIPRHWKSKHRNESEIIKLMSLGGSDKKAELQYAARLRNLGVHKHNVQVLKEGRGILSVARFATHLSPADYLPCEYCLSYVSDVPAHHCKCKPDWEQCVSKKHARFLLPTSKNFDDQAREMLDEMKDGNVKLVAQSEQLIAEYVAKLLSIAVADTTVKGRMHLLARFLLEIRKLTGLCNATLRECISPQNFHRCTEAAKMLGTFGPETPSHRKLTSTVPIRNILRQLSKLLKRDAIDRRDEDAVRDMDVFAELCMTEWKCPDTSPEDEASLNMEPNSD